MNRPPERLDTMKLPTTPLPVTLQDMKLQSNRSLSRSFERLAQKLRNMAPIQVARSGSDGQSAAESAQLLINKTNNKRTKLFLNLLLVRPWVLVLGFWLFSMMVGSLALGGMLSPRRLTQALPEPAVAENSQPERSSINVEKAADELALEGGVLAEAEATAEEGVVTAADSSASFPVVPVVVLVSSCAAGSLLISRRRAAMRLSAARAKGRARQVRQPQKGQSLKRNAARGGQPDTAKTVVSKAVVAQAAAPKKRRHRAKRNTRPVQKPGQNARVLISRADAQLSNGQGVASRKAGSHQNKTVANAKQKLRQKPSQKKSLSARAQANRMQSKKAARGAKRHSRVSMRAASRRQPVVSVVPASERHALDWSQGSLAHQMDVRHQQRAM